MKIKNTDQKSARGPGHAAQLLQTQPAVRSGVSGGPQSVTVATDVSSARELTLEGHFFTA